jgi:hypothetical protein
MNKNYFSTDPSLNPLFGRLQQAYDWGRLNEDQANKYLTIFTRGIIPMGSFSKFLGNANQAQELPNVAQHQPQFNFQNLANQNNMRRDMLMNYLNANPQQPVNNNYSLLSRLGNGTNFSWMR